ncbi:MAG TPA: hypothetical protein VGE52_13145 [Pirellulales bacterium]
MLAIPRLPPSSFRWISSAVLGVAVLAASLAAASPSAAQELRPIVGMDGRLFPSHLIATAALKPAKDDPPAEVARLGDPYGVLGVSVVAPADRTSIRVTIAESEFLEASEHAGVLPQAGRRYRVYPYVKYKHAALAAVRQAVSTDVKFTVSIGQTRREISAKATVRSVNECPHYWYHRAEDDTGRDLAYVFAVYVNEDHPAIDDLLQEALDTKVVSTFDGYRSGKPLQVHLQVFAIWHALQQRGMKYRDVRPPADVSELVSVQPVRFVEDSLRHNHANCVDGTVLLASALRKIGVRAALVFVPEHCYLAYYAGDEAKRPFGLETTFVGDLNLAYKPMLTGFGEAIDPAVKRAPSYASFQAALESGTTDLTRDAKKFESDDDYVIVDVNAARERGVRPLWAAPKKKREALKPTPQPTPGANERPGLVAPTATPTR